MEKLFGIEMDVLAGILAAGTVLVLGAILLLALRNKVLLKLAVRNIPRRKAQSVLIVVGLMLSTTIIMSALAIGDSVSSSIRTTVLDAVGETDVRLESPIQARFGDNYFDASMVDRVRDETADDSRVDGVTPLIRETLPVLNEATDKTNAGTFVVGIDTGSLGGFREIRDLDGNLADLDAVDPGEAIINKALAEDLEAEVGDTVTLVAPSGRTEYMVIEIVENKGLAGGDGETRSSMLLDIGSMQEVLDRAGQYNSIEVSVTGGRRVDEQDSDDLAEELQLAFINREAAQTLFDALKTPVVLEGLQAELDESGGAAAGPFASDTLEELVTELENDDVTDEFLIAATNTLTLAIVGGVIEEVGDPRLAQSLLLPMSQLVELQSIAIKNFGLDIAEIVGSQITLIFSIFGSFSIIVGLLLIFLVFVMLAAARTTEMGIIRAVGTKRRMLVQMFTYEGIVYSIGAAALGTVLGLIASVALVQIMIGALGSEDDFTFTYNVTLQSVVVAFCAGLFLTAITVAFSAYRVSKLNIVVAIRGLGQEFVKDETPAAGKRLRTALRWLSGPVTQIIDSLRKRKAGFGWKLPLAVGIVWLLLVLQNVAAIAAPDLEDSVVAQAITAAIVYWLAVFLWKVYKLVQPWLASGWPLLPIGLLMALSGFHPDKGIEGLASDNAALFTGGTTVLIIAVGLIIRRLMERRGYREEPQKRVSMTFIGLAMLIFWALPFDALDWLTGELSGGVEMFLLSGVSLVAAAVWVVMHNADVIVWIVSKLIGRFGSLRPVVKMAIAYPMAARFRTGLTLAMFSLVIFTLMIFAILSNLGNAIEDEPDLVSGGFDIRTEIDPELPIGDIDDVLAASGGELSASDFSAISSQALVQVETRESDSDEPVFKGARVVASDEVWMNTNNFKLTHWDPAYGDTPSEIWAAVAADSSLAVVAGNIVATDDFGGGEPGFGTTFRMDGIDSDLKGEFEGVGITIRPPIGQGSSGISLDRKVIGVLDQFADAFELGSADIYMNPAVLDEISRQPIEFSSHKFQIAGNRDAEETARLLETVFIDHGMTARATEEDIRENQAQNNAFNQLFQGFMGLGLLVGVAALGVVSFRAVVERRQSIGMMRALGYKGRMIQIQFLMESGVVAILGSAIGIGLGALIGWNIFNAISADIEGVKFVIPWLNVTIIVLVAVVFSLLNTVLPARQAAAITPTDALRYE